MTAVTIHIRRYPNRRLYGQRLAPALVVLTFHHAGLCSRDIMKPCAKRGRIVQLLSEVRTGMTSPMARPHRPSALRM
jgi:hypothetical protein